MKKACLWIFAFALLGSLQALPAAAQSYPDCGSHCTASTPCDDECLSAGGGKGEGEPVTCGEYGICEGYTPPPCTSNWVLASSQPIGGFAEYFYFPSYWCRYHGIYRRTWHDTNGCQPDYQDCIIGYQTTRPDLACCTYFWCGGDTCGYN